MANVGVNEADIFLTLGEAARLLGLTAEGLRGRLRRRELPEGIVFRLGKRSIRFDRRELLAWVRSQGYSSSEGVNPEVASEGR